MKCAYWISYRYQLPGSQNGFGAAEVVIDDGPLRPDHIPGIQRFLASLVSPQASIAIIAISKFEG
jgi:hypothetical protein